MSSDGGYILAAYLLGKPVGAGKIQFLGKFANANFSDSLAKAADLDYDQNTTEINFNYIIKDFNARVMFFWKLTDFGGDAGDRCRTSSSSASASRSRCNRVFP